MGRAPKTARTSFSFDKSCQISRRLCRCLSGDRVPCSEFPAKSKKNLYGSRDLFFCHCRVQSIASSNQGGIDQSYHSARGGPIGNSGGLPGVSRRAGSRGRSRVFLDQHNATGAAAGHFASRFARWVHGFDFQFCRFSQPTRFHRRHDDPAAYREHNRCCGSPRCSLSSRRPFPLFGSRRR